MDFKTIGRADPVGKIQGWQQNESILKAQAQQRAVTDLDLQVKKQEHESNQRRINTEIEQNKKQLKEVPWEVATMGFETGKGSPGAFLTETAKKAGLLDMSTGVPTINGKRKMELAKIMGRPGMVAKLNRVTVVDSKTKFNKARAELAKKPNDLKAQAAFQKASAYYIQSVNNTKIFAEKVNTLKESYTKGKKEYEFLNAAEQKYINQGMPEVEAKKQALRDLEYIGNEGGATNSDNDGDSGKVQLSEYRQWYKSASTEAMKRIFANTPAKQSELKIFMNALDSGDMETAKETENSLTQAMTDEQYNLYQTNIKEFFNRSGVPNQIREIFNKNIGGQPIKEQPEQRGRQLPDPAEYPGKTIRYQDGSRHYSDGESWKQLNG